jgi:spore coat protein U-like protein
MHREVTGSGASRLMLVLCAGLLLLLGSSRSAEATCSVSASGVAFGTYDVLGGAAVDSTGAVVYNCEPQDHDVLIALSPGSSGTYTARTLMSGSNQLSYNLYTDAARTQIWGDGTGSTDVYQKHNPQNNRDVTVTIYGRIPGGQDGAVGSYADSIVATINF